MAVTKSEALNVRLTAEQKQLIERAAKTTGKSKASFVVENAIDAARDVLMSQRFIAVSSDVFEDACKIVNAKPATSPALIDAFKRDKVWS